MTLSKSVLVDANVVCYYFLKCGFTEPARELLLKNKQWISESFLLVEVTSALVTALRAKVITEKQAILYLDNAVELFKPLGLVTVDHSDALKIAVEFKVSAYDARYLVVARNYNLRLVTEDKRLRAAAPD